MEIRYKEFLNAKVLYETMLTTFTANPDIVAAVLQQYSELCLKYFRDIDVRKLLRSYFEAYPFHEGLFFTVLRFYRNHVEVKEGSREGKMVIEQVMDIVVEGLRRAKETLPFRYSHISKLARKIMRDYVGTIYSVKTAERKIREMEMNYRRESQQSFKRDRGEGVGGG